MRHLGTKVSLLAFVFALLVACGTDQSSSNIVSAGARTGAVMAGPGVLFVGNSLTATVTAATGEDMPAVLSRLASSRGKTFNIHEAINLGQTLQDTWDKGIVQPYLTGSTQWDFVVLQERSTLPITDPATFYSTVLNTYQAAVQRSLKPGSGRLVLFENWALMSPTLSTRADDRNALDASYASLSTQLSTPNLTEPLGTAWEKVFATKPLSYLFNQDGTHPNDAAIYLNACMFYGLLFNESPVGLPALYLTAADAAFLQGVAAQLGDPTGSDAGVDAGPPPPPPPATLFYDSFNRTTGLGPGWAVIAGLWKTSSRAETDLDGTDQAAVQGLSCADCSVSARVVNFSATAAALDLREQSAGGNRYDVALLSDGTLQIRRHNGGGLTVLGSAPSGIADLSNWATIALSAAGANPVQLVASVNGAPVLSVTDSSPSAIATAGTAGISTNLAGIWFGAFTVTGTVGGGGGPDGGSPDAGTPDAGTPDAGTPDAGTGGDGGVIFSDSFNRNASSLGPAWTVLAGAWIDDTRANSDRDALDRATVTGVSCADCRIDSRAVAFGGGEAMLELRTAGTTRYALVLATSGNLVLRRYRSGTATTLAQAPSGIADLTNWSSLSFSIAGTAPVVLSGYVNNVLRVTATDSSSQAITAAGAAGIAATMAGIWFDDFTLRR